MGSTGSKSASSATAARSSFPNAILVDTAVYVRILEAVSGVDGVQVHYRVSETARTVLLLNGKKVSSAGAEAVTP